MKKLLLLSGFACLIAMLLPACAPPPEPEPEPAPEPVFDQAAEEAAIRKVSKQYFAAYNKHDADALAAWFVEDLENWKATQRSLADLIQVWTKSWERQPDGQLGFGEEIGIIFVTPDVAIHKYIENYLGNLDADGKPLPPSKGIAADIYVKKNGKWLCAAFFNRPIEE